MEKSDTIDVLATALAKAQAKMKPAVKDSRNPHFNSKYADLASVWDACRDPLSTNDLAIVQLPATDGNIVSITTMLMHKSGQWISSTASAHMARTDPQSIGSAITYLRRYGLSAMVGIAPEEDDGEAAMSRGQSVQRQIAETPPASPPVNWVDEIAKAVTEEALDVVGGCIAADNSLKAEMRKKLGAVFRERRNAIRALNGERQPGQEG